MGEQSHQNKTLFSEFVEAIIDHRLGDFMRERKVSARILSSKVREGNVHGSAWQTMLQHVISANMLAETVDALKSYGEEIEAGQFDQASRAGLKNLISMSNPEQARLIAEIIKKSGREMSYADIITPAPDAIDHHIVTTHLDTLEALLDAFGHKLRPDDITRGDSAGRTILQGALSQPEQTGHLMAFLEETGTRIGVDELERFYSTHQSHLGQTARTLMAIATDAGNAEALLKLPMEGGKTGIETMTQRHFGDILGAMSTAEDARNFLNSPLWRGQREPQIRVLNALLESNFAKDDSGWVQEFVSRIQIQRSKELISSRRQKKQRRGGPQPG